MTCGPEGLFLFENSEGYFPSISSLPCMTPGSSLSSSDGRPPWNQTVYEVGIWPYRSLFGSLWNGGIDGVSTQHKMDPKRDHFQPLSKHFTYLVNKIILLVNMHFPTTEFFFLFTNMSGPVWFKKQTAHNGAENFPAFIGAWRPHPTCQLLRHVHTELVASKRNVWQSLQQQVGDVAPVMNDVYAQYWDWTWTIKK